MEKKSMVLTILLNHFLLKIRGWLCALKNITTIISMNLRQRESIMYENLQLKHEKAELEKKLSDLMIMLDTKMTMVVDVLNQIKDKPNITTQVRDDVLKKIEKIESEKSTPMFIPTPDSSNLKINVQDIKKNRRNSNIADSLDKLSKLQEKP
jgi:hypothetical protein